MTSKFYELGVYNAMKIAAGYDVLTPMPAFRPQSQKAMLYSHYGPAPEAGTQNMRPPTASSAPTQQATVTRAAPPVPTQVTSGMNALDDTFLAAAPRAGAMSRLRGLVGKLPKGSLAGGALALGGIGAGMGLGRALSD